MGADLEEIAGEGFRTVQEEYDGYNEFGKQSVAFIDKENDLTQAQQLSFRPALFRRLKQQANPLQVVPFPAPPFLLLPALLGLLLRLLAVRTFLWFGRV